MNASFPSDPQPATAPAPIGGFYYRRLAARVATAAILAMAALAWLGRDLLPHFASPRAAALLMAFALATACLLGAVYVGLSITAKVSRPAARLAFAAESAAGGNLGVEVPVVTTRGEVGRLAHAVRAVIERLRALATALRGSAAEASSMASEITNGTDAMAASAQEMAATSSQLSVQAAEMADTLQGLSGDALRLVAIAEELSAGASEALERNGQVRTLARENGERLDASAAALDALATDADASAASVDSVAAAAAEITAFVTLVQKMARQSKLLALNAAMEAARAGEHGSGFAVVANEVRRLAANSADAAERTTALVQQVLEKVELSRASSTRTAATVREVLAATRLGHESFAEVERALATAEDWAESIAAASTSSNDLVRDMNGRVELLARGTESFAAAMQQVAASSEEQSASTQQIAATAAALSTAAAQLTSLVASFQLGDGAAPTAPPAAPVRERAAPRALVPVTA